MARKAGRPRDEAKGEAILQAAGECFLASGIEGASMDAIAEAAGVSKLTVYNHYGSKEALYKAVIAAKCREFAPVGSYLELSEEEPRAALTRIAAAFMRLMLQPEVVAMHRVVIGEAARNPRMAQMLMEAGARPTLAAFTDLLRAWVEAGRMDVPAPERAADHFFHMLKGQIVQELILNLRATPSSTEVKRHVDDCVDMFVRAYGRR